MAATSPSLAVDAFTGAIATALGCIARCSVIASGRGIERPISVMVMSIGQDPGALRLRSHAGSGELHLDIACRLVVRQSGQVVRSFVFQTLGYRFDILDRFGNEILVFHREPESISPFHYPHVHPSAAGPVDIAQPGGLSTSTIRVYLSKLHIPTGIITMADIVELLIRDFGVIPIVENWEALLARSRNSLIDGQI